MEKKELKSYNYGQHRINNFLLQKGFELKIKTRFWIKKLPDGSYYTVQFLLTKRLTNFTLDFGLYLPCKNNKFKTPKPSHEHFICELAKFIPPRELYIECTDNIELMDEMIDAYLEKIDSIGFSMVEKYLNIAFIKEYFPNRSELYMLSWDSDDKNLIQECLDNL